MEIKNLYAEKKLREQKAKKLFSIILKTTLVILAMAGLFFWTFVFYNIFENQKVGMVKAEEKLNEDYKVCGVYGFVVLDVEDRVCIEPVSQEIIKF